MKSNTNQMTYYYEELLLNQVLATAKEIHKRLNGEDLNLACKCSACPAYITLNLKNGNTAYVARKKDYQSATKDYRYIVQVLEDDDDNNLKVICQTTYTSNGKITSDVPDNMLPIAAKVIRMNKRR